MHGLNEKQRKEVLKLVCNCCNDNITVVDSGEYTLTNTDNIIHVVYTNSGDVTIVLPSANYFECRRIVVKDAGGSAGTNNINIEPQPTETIDGLGGVSISSDYGFVELYS